MQYSKLLYCQGNMLALSVTAFGNQVLSDCSPYSTVTALTIDFLIVPASIAYQ